MSNTTPITKLVPASTIRDTAAQYGAPWPPGWTFTIALNRGLPADEVRHLAANYRAMPDPVLPDRPKLIADALDRLADTVDARPVADWDCADVTAEHRGLFADWADGCESMSLLLEPVASALRKLAGPGPAPAHARRVLAVLSDADLLSPGIDAALRAALTVYAGEPTENPTDPKE